MSAPTCKLAVLALAALASACQSEAEHATREPAASGMSSLTSSADPATVLRAHLASAFVVPLLDDDEPPRFTDLHPAVLCTERSHVTVDGRPVIPGDLVPPGAFVLHWDAEMYCPFGHGGPVVDGRAEVLVFRDDEQGLTATLRADTLRVDPSTPLDGETAVRAAYVTPEAVRTVAAR